MQLQACERAAMLTRIAEDFAARRLAGEVVSVDETLHRPPVRCGRSGHQARAQAYRAPPSRHRTLETAKAKAQAQKDDPNE
jgi:hypothetical protein